MSELICQIHGPYDSSYVECPYCAGVLAYPPAPNPLGAAEDDFPTEIGGGPGGDWPDDEDKTELGQNYAYDSDLSDKTELGRVSNIDETEFDVIDEGPLAILWVKEGHGRGHINRIKEGSVLGRSQGDVIIDDPKASNPHAKFRFEEGKFVVWDFGSRNGTFVNGERIRAATQLNENDEIKIGDITYVFKVLM